MPKFLNNFHTFILCGVFILVQSSCATQPPPLPTEIRAQLGKIGVVSAKYTPEPDFEGPGIIFTEHLRGAWEGLKSGTKEGAQKGGSIGVHVLEFTQEYHGFWHPGALILALASSIVGATVGTVMGGVVGITEGIVNPDTDEVPKDSEILGPVLDWYLEELGIQERLRKEVVSLAKKNTFHPIEELEVGGPVQRGSEVNYQKLEEHSFKSILEVSVLSFGVKSDSSSDPIFSVFLTVKADLQRVKDNALLYRVHLTHSSPSLSLDQWTVNNALAFRTALNEGYRKLAEQIVGTLL